MASLRIKRQVDFDLGFFWDSIKHLAGLDQVLPMVEESILHGQGSGAIRTFCCVGTRFRLKFTSVDDKNFTSLFKHIEPTVEGIQSFVGYVHLRAIQKDSYLLSLGCSYIDTLNRIELQNQILIAFEKYILKITGSKF